MKRSHYGKNRDKIYHDTDSSPTEASGRIAVGKGLAVRISDERERGGKTELYRDRPRELLYLQSTPR